MPQILQCKGSGASRSLETPGKRVKTRGTLKDLTGHPLAGLSLPHRLVLNGNGMRLVRTGFEQRGTSIQNVPSDC